MSKLSVKGLSKQNSILYKILKKLLCCFLGPDSPIVEKLCEIAENTSGEDPVPQLNGDSSVYCDETTNTLWCKTVPFIDGVAGEPVLTDLGVGCDLQLSAVSAYICNVDTGFYDQVVTVTNNDGEIVSSIVTPTTTACVPNDREGITPTWYCDADGNITGGIAHVINSDNTIEAFYFDAVGLQTDVAPEGTICKSKDYEHKSTKLCFEDAEGLRYYKEICRTYIDGVVQPEIVVWHLPDGSSSDTAPEGVLPCQDKEPEPIDSEVLVDCDGNTETASVNSVVSIAGSERTLNVRVVEDCGVKVTKDYEYVCNTSTGVQDLHIFTTTDGVENTTPIIVPTTIACEVEVKQYDEETYCNINTGTTWVRHVSFAQDDSVTIISDVDTGISCVPEIVDAEVDYVCNETTGVYDRIVTVFTDGVEVSSVVTPTTILCDQPKPDFEFREECRDGTLYSVLYQIAEDGTYVEVDAINKEIDCPEKECVKPAFIQCFSKYTRSIGYDNGVTEGSSDNDGGLRANFISFSWNFTVDYWEVNGQQVGQGEALGAYSGWTPQLEGWSDFFNDNDLNPNSEANFGFKPARTWRYSEIKTCDLNAKYGELRLTRDDGVKFTVYPLFDSLEIESIEVQSFQDCDGNVTKRYFKDDVEIEKPEDFHECYYPCGIIPPSLIQDGAESDCETTTFLDKCHIDEDGNKTKLAIVSDNCEGNIVNSIYTLDSYLSATAPDEYAVHDISEGKLVNCADDLEFELPTEECKEKIYSGILWRLQNQDKIGVNVEYWQPEALGGSAVDHDDPATIFGSDLSSHPNAPDAVITLPTTSFATSSNATDLGYASNADTSGTDQARMVTYAYSKNPFTLTDTNPNTGERGAVLVNGGLSEDNTNSVGGDTGAIPPVQVRGGVSSIVVATSDLSAWQGIRLIGGDDVTFFTERPCWLAMPVYKCLDSNEIVDCEGNTIELNEFDSWSNPIDSTAELADKICRLIGAPGDPCVSCNGNDNTETDCWNLDLGEPNFPLTIDEGGLIFAGGIDPSYTIPEGTVFNSDQELLDHLNTNSGFTTWSKNGNLLVVELPQPSTAPTLQPGDDDPIPFIPCEEEQGSQVCDYTTQFKSSGITSLLTDKGEAVTSGPHDFTGLAAGQNDTNDPAMTAASADIQAFLDANGGGDVSLSYDSQSILTVTVTGTECEILSADDDSNPGPHAMTQSNCSGDGGPTESCDDLVTGNFDPDRGSRWDFWDLSGSTYNIENSTGQTAGWINSWGNNADGQIPNNALWALARIAVYDAGPGGGANELSDGYVLIAKNQLTGSGTETVYDPSITADFGPCTAAEMIARMEALGFTSAEASDLVNGGKTASLSYPSTDFWTNGDFVNLPTPFGQWGQI